MPERNNHLASGAVAITLGLGLGLALAGCSWAAGGTPPQTPEPPPPATSAPAGLAPASEEATTADLWSDDRSRTDTPLLDIDLEPETQWAIFTEVCGQDPDAFCALMAIAHTESHFTPDLVGDDGKSFGMMQINTKWHTGRMEALGVTDLADPVQCAAVALDYLQELARASGNGFEDDALYMAYNMGPFGARRALAQGRTSTNYSKAVLATYHEYRAEMEWTDDGE